MKQSLEMVRTVDLGYEQMLLLSAQHGTVVRVMYGGVWLTEEGRSHDVFAHSGDEIRLASHGVALVQGLGFARVQVVTPMQRAAAVGHLGLGLVQALKKMGQQRLAELGHDLARLRPE